jgi:hypothetical protein
MGYWTGACGDRSISDYGVGAVPGDIRCSPVRGIELTHGHQWEPHSRGSRGGGGAEPANLGRVCGAVDGAAEDPSGSAGGESSYGAGGKGARGAVPKMWRPAAAWRGGGGTGAKWPGCLGWCGRRGIESGALAVGSMGIRGTGRWGCGPGSVTPSGGRGGAVAGHRGFVRRGCWDHSRAGLAGGGAGG